MDLFGLFGVSDVKTENATLSIGATRGSPPLFEQAPVVAYAVRQTGTFGDCVAVIKQADVLLAQPFP